MAKTKYMVITDPMYGPTLVDSKKNVLKLIQERSLSHVDDGLLAHTVYKVSGELKVDTIDEPIWIGNNIGGRGFGFPIALK